MNERPFVPADFDVPPVLETDRFRLRMLAVGDNEKDYEAVMETQARFLARGWTWPREGFTLAENLSDLERHQQEFLDREAFAYTVVSPDESRVLGCVYINPEESEAAEASVWMWVREREFVKGLEPVLFEAVKAWIERDWPFRDVIYTERDW